MTHFLKTWARPVAGAMALLLVLTVTAVPVAAAEAPKPAAAAPQTLAAAADAKLATLNTNAALALAQSTGSTDRPFFKSRKGALVAVLMVVGVGYTIYSADKDRVHSPIR